MISPQSSLVNKSPYRAVLLFRGSAAHGGAAAAGNRGGVEGRDTPPPPGPRAYVSPVWSRLSDSGQALTGGGRPTDASPITHTRSRQRNGPGKRRGTGFDWKILISGFSKRNLQSPFSSSEPHLEPKRSSLSSFPSPSSLLLCRHGLVRGHRMQRVLFALQSDGADPRMLYCLHTFCQPCLEKISQSQAGLITLCCPLCRRVTCMGQGLGLQGALWVDSALWDQIEEEEEEEEEEEDNSSQAQSTSNRNRRSVRFQEETLCNHSGLSASASASARTSRTKLKLPAFSNVLV
ncbi:hypothetical protein WMY93_024368 [Mugilogobius chulae]|uniref:RING-type domain-containing protein n=1 Tax=Mugilogobius chulae TaxID=88201 RepID=A0AAW0N2U7_9GOBI